MNRKAAESRNPRGVCEWLQAVDQAAFLLALDDCAMYGLIEGGPVVNRKRCLEILERGKKRGIHPRPLQQLVDAYLQPG